METSTFIGINIGSVTLKVVELSSDNYKFDIISHKGQPTKVIEEIKSNSSSNSFFSVSGHMGNITETMAIERALSDQQQQFDAIISLGGEAFGIYLLKNNRIHNVLSQNRCAAGSGEFLVQQVSRLNLTLEEAIQKAKRGKSIRLASRCSVHCKSDVTHKLNRKEASVEDILWSIHESMANKIVSLLEKTKDQCSNILVIGGLSRNEVMIDILRDKLSHVRITVLPQSAYFEAWGTALLCRDKPIFKEPKIKINPIFTDLPELNSVKSNVDIIEEVDKKIEEAIGPYIIGIDGGSTTTKAVLIDMSDKKIIASHYTRTNGDPLSAVKECITSIINKAGDLTVYLVASTGSAREIIAAYMGTAAVYNEISAHATGAAYFDDEVDTIFEIGGQDAKYIFLQNGVPVDYAMNAACSAGTGSFLEESAQGDLGISVYDIADIALNAPSPVKFKAECAAFINSDIRSALQEGYSKENIIGGLVTSIVTNYLLKVKGTRAVGDKIFVQGGVAKNKAVVYAFAQETGKNVIVPPHPELMGAFGVALMADERLKFGDLQSINRKLSNLISSEMKNIGSFTCRACENYCNIDRFEVSGRKFPFGGRCSKYENSWKNIEKVDDVEDLVELRNNLIFSIYQEKDDNSAIKIGIPKALSTHFLFPLYYSFLTKMGFNAVLSGIDSNGEFKTNSSFCYPTQIAHSAVLDLLNQGIKTIFMPQVSSMPLYKGDKSSICPVTQASPYILKKAFSEVNFLTTTLDFKYGYENSNALIDLAVNKLGIEKQIAVNAYHHAIIIQKKVEQSMQELGCKYLDIALKSNKPAIILVGRSYNAFPKETSQSISKKLTSKGIMVIPYDCLPIEPENEFTWYFSNKILDSVNLSKKNKNLFVLYIKNFGCNVDAFTLEFLRNRIGNKPYLSLEIDSHTADAGTQTRLEAFIEIINHFNTTKKHIIEDEFNECMVIENKNKMMIRSSSGEIMDVKDPRVKIYLPVFSKYHNEAIPMALRWMGINSPNPIELDKDQLDLGLRYTSGKECLPLPITLGQLLYLCENRDKGDIIGFYVITGGAPCVIDAYIDYYKDFIKRLKLEDVFFFVPRKENRFFGLGKKEIFSAVPPAIVLGDIMNEIHNTLAVVSDDGIKQLREVWKQFINKSTSKSIFDRELDNLINQIKAIPVIKDVHSCPKVLITGDFFTRFDSFFMDGIMEKYIENGIILKPADLNELLLYPIYDTMGESALKWKNNPSTKRAALTACTKCFTSDGLKYLGSLLSLKVLERLENKLRGKFMDTNLLIAETNNLAKVYQNAKDHIHPSIYGESILSIGRGITSMEEKYNGIILVGPFSCLPFKISEAILKPYCLDKDFPILSYETDGNSASPAFLRLVDVHIQQIKRDMNNNLVTLPVDPIKIE